MTVPIAPPLAEHVTSAVCICGLTLATAADATWTVTGGTAASVAETRTLRLYPTSRCVGVYVRPVAPAIELHELPAVAPLQSCHWKEYVTGAVPLHVPGSADSVVRYSVIGSVGPDATLILGGVVFTSAWVLPAVVNVAKSGGGSAVEDPTMPCGPTQA